MIKTWLKKSHYIAWIVGIVLFAFWIRAQGVEHLLDRQFTENDAYFYYWQAQLISEHGHLPERDMHRWLPLGRDLQQTLNLYGYALAYAHKALAAVFPNITLYHVTLYMPAVCFCIGIAALCLFLYYTYGLLFSTTVGLLLATLPGSIERSAVGFGDRDAWCIMIGILAVTTYLQSLKNQPKRKRFLWTLTSGVFTLLGGFSWEGFGVFLAVILVVELWRFLTSETEDGLAYYCLWVTTFVPTLYLLSPAYRSGYGFSEHLAALVLVPPLVLLGIRALRYLLTSDLTRYASASFADKLRTHPRALALGLTLASITLALAYVFIQLNTFASTTVPLSQNSLMQTVTELEDPHFNYWIFRYGSIFILGSIGLIIATKRHWEQTCMLIPITLFIGTTFFRQPLEAHILRTSSHSAFFFLIALICIGIAFLITARLQNTHKNAHLTYIAFTAWFLFWVALSRDAKRYDFFIGVPLAFFTAEIIHLLSNIFSCRVKQTEKRKLLTAAVATTLLAAILFLPPLGAHAKRSILAATRMRRPTPVHDVTKAFRWMKTTLPPNAVVAAHWRYGSQLNVIAGVNTIIDQDHYIQHWIHLYHTHIHKATDETEALTFLKTHGATHIMLTDADAEKSYLSQQLSDAFIQIYPETDRPSAKVKIWEIHYPPNIKTDRKYLKTGFAEIDDPSED